MSATPHMSLITPTYQRHVYLQAVHTALARQTMSDFEWLILDDGPAPAPYFAALDDPRVRYTHVPGPRMTIGAKRNWLAERARADVIAHIDDDDYYAPRYLETMLDQVRQGGDIVKLSAWFLFSKRYRTFGYWDLERKDGLSFVWSSGPIQVTSLAESPDPARWEHLPIAYGFSYVYRKAVWEQSRFPDQDFEEDTAFVRAARAKGAEVFLIKDTTGLALHVLHAKNSSLCLPQYNLPPFVMTRFFPAEVEPFLNGP